MSVAVITDSSACLDPEMVPDGLTVLPITIHLPSEDLSDASPEAARRVHKSVEDGEPVKSSSPSVASYVKAIEDGGAEEAVVITPAEEFTAMYRNASLAAELATMPAAVIDSRTAAAAQGLVVEAAMAAASGGGDLEQVARAARDAAQRARLVATVDSLEVIRQSGRVPSGALELAHKLGIRPIFALKSGEVKRLGVARTTTEALGHIRKELLRSGPWNDRGPVVFHADRAETAAELMAALGGKTRIREFSAAMSIQTGPGVVGAAWLTSASI
jgi:DegV family protein with EDD domain